MIVCREVVDGVRREDGAQERSEAELHISKNRSW